MIPGVGREGRGKNSLPDWKKKGRKNLEEEFLYVGKEPLDNVWGKRKKLS